MNPYIVVMVYMSCIVYFIGGTLAITDKHEFNKRVDLENEPLSF